jgi:hypothetical protein
VFVIRFIPVVTIGTGEFCIVLRIEMAVTTFIPLAPVFATVDRKVEVIMDTELCRIPVRIRGMA